MDDTLYNGTLGLVDQNPETLVPELLASYRASVDAFSRILVKSVGEDKLVWCYTLNSDFIGLRQSWYFEDDDSNSTEVTKCVRVGSGWQAENGHAQFFVETAKTTSATLVSNKTSVNIYSVSSALYLNTTTHHYPSPEEISLNRQIVEYDYPMTYSNGSTYSPGSYAAPRRHSFAFQAFGTYNMWVIRTFGPGRRYSYMSDPEPLDDLTYVHPGWVLAVWGVNHTGTVTGSMVGKTVDTAAPYLINALAQRAPFTDSNAWTLKSQHLAIISSAVTIIPYDEQLVEPEAVIDETETQPNISHLGRYYYVQPEPLDLFGQGLAEPPPTNGEASRKWLDEIRFRAKTPKAPEALRQMLGTQPQD
ncbi:hypothetical protein OQA88_8158 [Cercophora sp. LCS_1]